MSSKILIKSLVALFFVIIATLQFGTLNSNAAATSKVGWVSTNNDTVTVKSGPGASYKTVGSLKNNASVSVYSHIKNGWTEIGYKSKRAYIATQNVRMYSYLMDKKKVYTYKSGGEIFTVKYQGKYFVWDQWIDDDGNISAVKENNKGLYSGWPDDREYLTNLVYPLKVGKEWVTSGITYKIISIDGTLKTPAGTFNNVVTTKSSFGFIDYYAPNVGSIKVILDGKVIGELIHLENK
ncbi:SH3 domain-containing protein [Domibacillus sp.]|uniref:SH3 domain-containing protein n=1 Tax=Domibacillus sp. TaxID=1969783 RepID=UPI002811EC55|nr:SH3 domain-containing protein [Domibacillus sp.]